MLLKFRFKNFRSFKDENIFDMRATKMTELKYHIRNVSKNKILPVATMYGANASGKTNFILAFDFMIGCIIKSAIFENNSEYNIFSNWQTNMIEYAFVKNAKNYPITFEVEFLKNNKKYIYGFIVDKNGFKEEWLKQIKLNNEYINIITRKKYDKIELNLNSNMSENIIMSLKKTSLILSLGAFLNDELLITIMDWFKGFSIVRFNNSFFDSLISKNIISLELEKEHLKKIFLNYLSSFDKSIIDYKIKKEHTTNLNIQDSYTYNLYTYHKMVDSDKCIKIPLSLESDGIKKMISLFHYFFNTIKNGSIIVIDDLNAKLHPLVVRLIINMFTNPETNPSNAQLIFTTHDTWLMNNTILRRDEIWFSDKDDNGISELYSLSDFKDYNGKEIRKDENYIKNYMVGKYGGIPTLSLINLVDLDNK